MTSTANNHSHETWMNQAIACAREAECKDEVPVGAVIVRQGKLLSDGFNTTISSSDPTAHAEIIAIRKACELLGNYRLPGTSIYVTLEPCIMCMGAILHARIETLIFGAFDPKTGAAGSVYDIGQDKKLNHSLQIHGGVCKEICSEQLVNFFRSRRKK